MTEVPAATLDQMVFRLKELQTPLGAIMLKAGAIFDVCQPLAPHPSDMPENSPIWATTSINPEPSRELSIKLSRDKVMTIDKNPPSMPSFPLFRVVLWTPLSDRTTQKINAIDISHHQGRQGIPFDSEVALFDKPGRKCLDLLHTDYQNHEPYVAELFRALDEATQVASEALLPQQV